jgi:hypothetical protein
VYTLQGSVSPDGTSASAMHSNGVFSPTVDTWIHVAYVHTGTALLTFADGNLLATTATTASAFDTDYGPTIGSHTASPTGYLSGYIDDLRITKGVARYTATFTPPSAQFPDHVDPYFGDPYFSNVSLLLHGNGANGSTTFTDSGPDALTVTANGNAQISTAQNKYGTASCYFDGQNTPSTCLSLADSAAWHFAGAYTIEFWIRPETLKATSSWLFQQSDGTGGFAPIRIDLDPAGTLNCFGSTDNASWLFTSLPSSTSLSAGTWYHVAVSDDGVTFRLFINGVLEASRATWSKTNSTQLLRLFGGFPSGDREFNGWVDDLRITNGVARYTSSFTPPTAAFPEYGVTLLLHCNGANGSTTFTDSALGKTVTANGNAQISTAQSKWGEASALFDGTGDYLTLDGSSVFAFGTGDFTIEMWVRMVAWSAGVYSCLIDFRPAGTNGPYLFLGLSDTNVRTFTDSVSAVDTAHGMSLNTWTHVAVTRAGGSLRTFIAGTQIGSTYADSANYIVGASRPIIGANGTNPAVSNLSGHIDDLRITKGLARYTSAFTPPVAPFPNL